MDSESPAAAQQQPTIAFPTTSGTFIAEGSGSNATVASGTSMGPPKPRPAKVTTSPFVQTLVGNQAMVGMFDQENEAHILNDIQSCPRRANCTSYSFLYQYRKYQPMTPQRSALRGKIFCVFLFLHM